MSTPKGLYKKIVNSSSKRIKLQGDYVNRISNLFQLENIGTRDPGFRNPGLFMTGDPLNLKGYWF
jgi:hypothetical protein